MSDTITNLRALIDSGKRENIEMAAQLSVNLPDEWQWLHRYCKAKLDLPKNYASWYEMYCESVKFQGSERVHFLWMEGYEVKDAIFYQRDIQANVANEFHYLMLDHNPQTISRDISVIDYEISRNYSMTHDKIKELAPISLAKKIMFLLRRPQRG
jgi:hypothetical protein